MSSLSIPRPKKMSDGQFIGDLTKLLERRKIKCGDPLSLETFGSELSSNNILRSDLFTLCTAISHMGDEDLSGDQLLVLVGRAVGGPQVLRGEGSVEIPESMRAAFLSGYDAWGKRGMELSEPLAWPPPRPQLAWSEPVPVDVEESSSAAAPKAPASGVHTLQEALEIAKKRSPTGLAPQRTAGRGAHIEGLTISELKELLEDIEHRMSRIQPHLSQLSSIVDTAADTRRQQRADESDDVIPFRGASAGGFGAVAGARTSGALGSSLAERAEVPQVSKRSPIVDVSEEAFLARHPYMKPSKRKVPDFPISVLPATLIDSPPPPVAAAPPVVVDSLIPAASAPLVAASPATLEAAAAVPVAAPVETASFATVQMTSLPQVALVPLPLPTRAVSHEAAQAHVMGLNPIGEAVIYLLDGLRASPRLILGVASVLILVPCTFAGAFIYSYLHPKVTIKYPDPPPTVSQAPEVPANPLGGVAAPAGTTAPVMRSAASTMRVADKAQPARSALRPVSKPQPQAYVWPPPPDWAGQSQSPALSHPLIAAATSTPPAPPIATRPSRLTGPPASAIYVPSSTMIKYAVSAPGPVYPLDPARGMEGTVVLQITVSKQGDVSSARTVSGPVEFRGAAVQAVRMWHFKPYLFNGTPADVETTLELPFKPQ